MTATFVADRSPRGVVMVSGADATSFLQNLVSQDLDPVEQCRGVHALLLHPQGKVDVELRALHLDGSYDAAHAGTWALDCEAPFGERLAASLARFRIRVDVNLRDVSESAGLVSIVGTEDPVDAAALGLADGLDAAVHAHRPARDAPGIRVVRTVWGVRHGLDLLGPIEGVRAFASSLPDELVRVDAGAYEAFRIEAGVPRLGADIDESTIPQEAFLERDAVSFTKGCFLGQELVCRIDTRGHVNRFLRRVRLDGDVVPPAGATVVVADRDVGVVTSAAAVPGEARAVALAMVRREVEPPTEAVLRWDGTTRAALVEAI